MCCLCTVYALSGYSRVQAMLGGGCRKLTQASPEHLAIHSHHSPARWQDPFACPPPHGSLNWVLPSFGASTPFRDHWDNDALTFSLLDQPGWLLPRFAVLRYKPANRG